MPTVTNYDRMEMVQGEVVVYRPYMKTFQSEGEHHTSIKRSASDEDLEALRKRIKVEEQELSRRRGRVLRATWTGTSNCEGESRKRR